MGSRALAVLALEDRAATDILAAQLADLARPGDIIGLAGELGSGKTTFARAFIARASGRAIEVPSPTFNLVLTYDTPRGVIWHFDLYRLRRPEEVLELGFEEACASGIVLVEWPEKAGRHLPEDALILTFAAVAETKRKASLAGGGDWPARLEGLLGHV
jgi:tRNA threonylcarbamoyladenosine biosynthesis protein TsaE